MNIIEKWLWKRHEKQKMKNIGKLADMGIQYMNSFLGKDKL